MSVRTEERPTATVRPVRSGSVAGIVVLVLALVAAGVLSLAVGSRSIPFTTVLDVLLHPDGTDVSTIVHGLRLPRTVLCLSVGVCLGVAGALMQGHTRNPLAEPGLLGVSVGAAFAVVVGIYLFGVTSMSGYVWFSLIGAGLAAIAVFAIGSTRGGPDPVSLVLAGTAVSALLISLTQAIVLLDMNVLDEYRFWVVGSASGRDLGVFWQVLPFMLGGLVVSVADALETEEPAPSPHAVVGPERTEPPPVLDDRRRFLIQRWGDLSLANPA